MVFSTPDRADRGFKSEPAAGWFRFGSIAALAALCAKKAGQVTKKLRRKPGVEPLDQPSPRSPLARPKQVLKTISCSAVTLVHKKKNRPSCDVAKVEEEEEWGDGGVWQRSILMGDKCQPLDFSGVIYYDSAGKQMNEVPLRSPRASPLPGYLSRRAEL